MEESSSRHVETGSARDGWASTEPAEISEDLEAAGFLDARLLHRGEMDSLVTARKPE